ncbi:hypothetical protein BC374_12610 [Ensifer sp. LC13]|nr:MULTISPECIES: hypothetical protein [unclassified Ensifer]OCP02775.1 hypothetical protein BC362_02570 [Ensifer sp. LC14]OCP13676.1 hypothetical protein BC374_12610 [Ensifer sp. LC13]OCP14333.1 hypothetical protein BBX50_12890 [Ensifer sp. LC11]OCP29038.1 hypothetical protein BC364_11010 [Ensifer sp. LC499]
MRIAARSEPHEERVPRRTLARIVAAVLTLAAAPTLTLMALLTSAQGSGPGQIVCAEGAQAALGGMTSMYLLMAAFHLAPWLRLLGVSGDRAERV